MKAVAAALALLIVAGCGLGPTPGTWTESGRISGIQNILRLFPEARGRAVAVGMDADRKLGASLFERGTGQWTPEVVGPDPKGLSGFSITQLADGDVMVGVNQNWWAFRTASGSWSPTARMPLPQIGYAAAAIPDGRLLACGDRTSDSSLSTCQIYDSRRDTWSRAADMKIPRTFPAAITLPDGRVLVTGGFDQQTQNAIQTTEVYDPASDSWAPAEAFSRLVSSPQLIQLRSGDLMALGGLLGSGPGHTVQLMDERTGHWRNLAEAPEVGPAVELPDGRVMVLPGLSIPGARAAAYDRAADRWLPLTESPASLMPSRIARLDDGAILVTGSPGIGTHTLPSALFDPAAYPGLPGSAGPLASRGLTPGLLAAALVLLLLAGLRSRLPTRVSP